MHPTSMPSSSAWRGPAQGRGCGGTWGYAELLEILADPARVEHRDRRTWVGEQWHPEAFDVQHTNDLLALDDRLTGGN